MPEPGRQLAKFWFFCTRIASWIRRACNKFNLRWPNGRVAGVVLNNARPERLGAGDIANPVALVQQYLVPRLLASQPTALTHGAAHGKPAGRDVAKPSRTSRDLDICVDAVLIAPTSCTPGQALWHKARTSLHRVIQQHLQAVQLTTAP